MLTAFAIQLIVSLVLIAAAYLLMPRPKSSADEPGDFEGPSSSESKPMPVVFGTLEVDAPSCLWFGDSSNETKSVK